MHHTRRDLFLRNKFLSEAPAARGSPCLQLTKRAALDETFEKFMLKVVLDEAGLDASFLEAIPRVYRVDQSQE